MKNTTRSVLNRISAAVSAAALSIFMLSSPVAESGLISAVDVGSNPDNTSSVQDVLPSDTDPVFVPDGSSFVNGTDGIAQEPGNAASLGNGPVSIIISDPESVSETLYENTITDAFSTINIHYSSHPSASYMIFVNGYTMTNEESVVIPPESQASMISSVVLNGLAVPAGVNVSIFNGRGNSSGFDGSFSVASGGTFNLSGGGSYDITSLSGTLNIDDDSEYTFAVSDVSVTTQSVTGGVINVYDADSLTFTSMPNGLSTYTVDPEDAYGKTSVYFTNSVNITFANEYSAAGSAVITATGGTLLSTSDVPASVNVARRGYNLVWYNGSNPWNFATDTLPAGTLTLTARYSLIDENKIPVTVSFESGDVPYSVSDKYYTGDLVAASDAHDGDMPYFPAPLVLKWYSLINGVSSETAWDFATDTIPGDMTLQCKESLPVKYYSNDGITLLKTDYYSASAGLSTLYNPGVADFAGWRTAADNGGTLTTSIAANSVDAVLYYAVNVPDVISYKVGTGEEQFFTDFNTGWSVALAASDASTPVTVKLYADWTAADGNSVALHVYSGKNIILDLNGHTISRNLTSGVTDGYVISNSGTLEITDRGSGEGKITGGYSANYSGGVTNDGALTVSGGIITGNNGNSGGGIYNSGTVTITGGTISENDSSYGGGIYNTGTVNISAGTISGNAAAEGGGIYNKGVSGSIATVNVSGTASITLNTASNNGGGLLNYSQYSVINVISGGITNNTSGKWGGGIADILSGEINVSGGAISNNEAAAYGGGIYTIGSLTITAGTISNNTSAKGGGIVNTSSSGSGGSRTVSHVTISGGSITGNSATADTSGGIISDGELTINGTASITGNEGSAVTHSSESLIISGTANITSSDETYPTVTIGNGTFEMTGGTVHNTANGRAVDVNSEITATSTVTAPAGKAVFVGTSPSTAEAYADFTITHTGTLYPYISFGVPTALVFEHLPEFDVPTGNTGTDAENSQSFTHVSGGIKPYTISVENAPDWLTSDAYGCLTGTRPSTPQAATTAIIRVTDSTSPTPLTKAVEISIGEVTYHSCSITYNVNGGTMPEEYTQTADEGSDVTLPVPTKQGAMFVGWLNDSNHTLYDGTISNISTNVSVTAQWSVPIADATFVVQSLDDYYGFANDSWVLAFKFAKNNTNAVYVRQTYEFDGSGGSLNGCTLRRYPGFAGTMINVSAEHSHFATLRLSNGYIDGTMTEFGTYNIIDNRTLSASGPAINIASDSYGAEITNVSILSNKNSAGNGGAICSAKSIYFNHGGSSISEVSIYDCSAVSGGAIYATGGLYFQAGVINISLNRDLDGNPDNIYCAADNILKSYNSSAADTSKVGLTFPDDYDLTQSVYTTAIPNIFVCDRPGYVFTVEDTNHFKFTPDTTDYTITYDFYYENVGFKSGYTPPATYRSGTTLALPTIDNMDCTGYTMTGWRPSTSDTSNLSNIVYTEIPSYCKGNVTLQAEMDVIYYDIVYELNGGEVVMQEVPYLDLISNVDPFEYAKQYTYFSPRTLPDATALTKEHYSFGGWYDNAACEGTAVTVTPDGSTGTLTYYAKWIPDTYNITYNVNGGSWVALPSATYAYGIAQTLPVNLTKTGFTFAGWYDNADLTGTPVETLTVTDTGAKTFYAKWTPNTYDITYTVNGGTWSGAHSSSYTYGTALTLPTNLTKTGCTFDGWFTNADLTGTPVEALTADDYGDKTFYAKWTFTDYTITYNYSGGTPIHNDFSTGYNYGYAIDTPKLTRSGYVFAGWIFVKTGTTDVIYSGRNYPRNVTGDLTATAVWSRAYTPDRTERFANANLSFSSFGSNSTAVIQLTVPDELADAEDIKYEIISVLTSGNTQSYTIRATGTIDGTEQQVTAVYTLTA